LKVGFGSAGAEIIRNYLERSRSSKANLQLNTCGSTISSIFLFCDIRNFTDITESLQEEVFVFTNKIAGVLHSICNAYGGNANKNIGDAFLMSWIINENPIDDLDILSIDSEFSFCDETKASKGDPTLADRALLSVVKIYMALQHDKYFLDTLSEKAQRSLVEKLEDRPGPVVQLGCGLHYGTAVQGAIGSPRKIDPTYISKDVDFSETLESSTKKYGVNAFHGLLLPSSRRRCRKIDRVMVYKEDGKEAKEEIIDLYTYDMDIDNLFFKPEDEVAHESVGESYDVMRRTPHFPLLPVQTLLIQP